MTALIETTMPPAAASRAPRALALSFYLWWGAIALQSIYIAYAGLTFGEAARIGGPAWDILLDLEVPLLVVLFATAIQIAFVFLLRTGFRGSRVVLSVIAAFMVPATFLTSAQAWRMVPYAIPMPNPAFLVVAILVLVSAAAIATMYLPQSNAFFRSHRSDRDAAQLHKALVPRPRLVVVAFWLWWPMIILETLGLVLFSAIVVASFIEPELFYYFILAAPIVLVAGTLGLVMMMLVFRMRRGSRRARGWLLGLAIAATALTLLELAGVITLVAVTAVEGLNATSPMAVVAQLVDGVAVVLALVGAILPFLPAARAFFAKTPSPAFEPMDSQRALID